MTSGTAWDTERAAELASRAYGYVGRVYPPDAHLAPLDGPQDAALGAQAAGDWSGYERALREMCAVALKTAKAGRSGAA